MKYENPNKTKQNKTKQNKTKRNKTKRNKTQVLKYRHLMSLYKNKGLIHFKISNRVRGHDLVDGGHGQPHPGERRVDIPVNVAEIENKCKPIFEDNHAAESGEPTISDIDQIFRQSWLEDNFVYIRYALLNVLVPKIIERILEQRDYARLNKILNYTSSQPNDYKHLRIPSVKLFEVGDLLELFAKVQLKTQIFTSNVVNDTVNEQSVNFIVFSATYSESPPNQIEFRIECTTAVSSIDSFMEKSTGSWHFTNETDIPPQRKILFGLVLLHPHLFEIAINKNVVFRYMVYLQMNDADFMRVANLYFQCNEPQQTAFKKLIDDRLKTYEKYKTTTEQRIFTLKQGNTIRNINATPLQLESDLKITIGKIDMMTRILNSISNLPEIKKTRRRSLIESLR